MNRVSTRLYRYVGNNPFNQNDPSGLIASDMKMLGGEIGGYLDSAYQNFNFPDYVSVSIPTPIPFVGANVTIDQYGSIYAGPGAGMGYPNVRVAIGWRVNEGHTVWNTLNPTPEELEGFLTGWGFGMGVGLNWTLTGQALTIMTPGIGATYSWKIW